MIFNQHLTRRCFHTMAAAAVGTACGGWFETAVAHDADAYQLNYMLPSCMYGYAKLAEILPEAKKIGATHLDVWPKVHGDQREQIDLMGEEDFAALLDRYDVQLGCITQYKLGPFHLQDEMRLAQRFGCQLMVTGAAGPKGLAGSELKAAISKFVEQMKPHLEVAEETGVTIAIENHANNLIFSPDSLRWLLEMRPSEHLAIAFAPYHLPQDEKLLADLIRDLGEAVAIFYAWQHGDGAHEPLPVERQLLQMPGRGPLDFRPLLEALVEIDYQGWTEVFMHPVPRGVPILPSIQETTDEINRGRKYLDEHLARVTKGK